MAWGLWNKIKQGFKKAGNALKTVGKAVVNKVVKPFKPMISGVAKAINPTFGKALDAGMDFAEKWSDEGFDSAAKGWARKRFSAGD